MTTGTKTLLDGLGGEIEHVTIENGGNTAFGHASLKTDGTPVNPATEAKQDSIISALAAVILAAGSAVIGKVDHTTTGIGHGVKTVTTAGTDVVLASSTPAKWVTIQAQTDNTGYIAVGASGVDATIATGDGVLLSAGESITIPCDNLADIYIDATVSTDGVRYTYGT